MIKALKKKFLNSTGISKHENTILELNQYPEVEKELRVLTEDMLFKVGYAVLTDAITILRNLSNSQLILEILKISNDKIDFWFSHITTAIHNLPEKLERKDTSYLKEEIYNAINVLYSLKRSNPELAHCIPISTPRTDLIIMVGEKNDKLILESEK
ncbi:hypothetical protein R6231_14410 [Bacillus cytotoxicus]|uniref:hypothetical protein n=1 Tax=Bacillus cereus group TaxID=86661 RepID=UPI000B966E43|nr:MULTISPECIES: hypothetical protein [Bacillus cereus group]AWC31024.1 hypothetical protein CG483_022665 [Bacillus cytotoxicus]AWC35028.1 hypothetical protein CG482_022480 [Bacillus cytotoxicus]AWC39066.1 hypothetical protein CG481_022480 [Bacillus cytotoxicus]AWC43116.1 hypothetical protein CG480_022500 [Bacillus cytotoxicus]AWC51047.1 hypothetical protein CG478_022500 [Bacillus cytotoxicus]